MLTCFKVFYTLWVIHVIYAHWAAPYMKNSGKGLVVTAKWSWCCQAAIKRS